MKKRTFIRTVLFVSIGLWATATAFAEPYRGRCFYGEVPPSFMEVCKGKTEGDKVHVQTPRGRNIQAVCIQDGAALRAMPERFHRQHEAMISACQGKVAGDRVRVTSPRGGTFDAVCENWGDTLSARPEKGKGFRNAYRGELLDACKGKAEGDTVEYTTPCGATFEAVCTLEGKELLAYPHDGWGYGGGYGYGSIYQACKDKKKGEKVSFETPCGAKVDVVCGDSAGKMGKGGRRPHHRGHGYWK